MSTVSLTHMQPAEKNLGPIQ